MRKLNKGAGFTLAELLIVVAIIAILVAIGIPAFSTAMERSRETVDLSNIRGAYAEFMSGTLGGKADTGFYKIDLKQRDCKTWVIDCSGFLTNIVDTGGNPVDTMPVDATNLKTGTVWVKFSNYLGNDKPSLSYVANNADGDNDLPSTGVTLATLAADADDGKGVVSPLEDDGTAGKAGSDWYLTVEKNTASATTPTTDTGDST